MHRQGLFVAATAIALIAGCRGADSPAGDPAANAAANETAVANGTGDDGAPAAALSAYIGKYPPDPVEGVAFLRHPAVTAAVAATLTDKDVAEWIFEKAGPQTPIAPKDGKLLSWGCEAHNCGSHNWTIAITPDGTTADICYFNEAESDKATWWLAGGGKEERPGGCPSGDEE